MPFELSPISHQIWDAKYRLKRPDGTPIDLTVEDTWRRVARALASAEKVEEREQWEARFFDAMDGFKFIPAGRILAGAGTGRSVTQINCFVQGTIPDSLDGIFAHLREAALTMQQGGGIGYDFSTLRPKGSLVKGVDADASGPLSFMDVWNAMCKTIMSAGARRGAMMACMRCDHPDIFDFVNAKLNNKHDDEWARLKHFNMSVLVTDLFMEAVKNDNDWFLHFPCGHELKANARLIKARELWDAIMRSTYNHAEPGVIFIDRVNDLNNLKYCEKINATNPCGEQVLPPYGSCDLGSINLATLVQNPFTQHAFIDMNDLEWIVPLAIRMLDNVYDVTRFPLLQQAEEARLKRRLGLGITGLANALTMCGLRYGTTQAAQAAMSWMQSIEQRAYRASAELAAEKGAFPLFDREEYRKAVVWDRLPTRVRGEVWDKGLRNSHLMAVAPTGTISLFADNVSSGVEPTFANKIKRKILQPDGSRTEVEILDHAYDRFLHLVINLPEDQRAELIKAWTPCFVTAQDLTPDEHLIMQSAVQTHCDTSISKTINCPDSISFDKFKEVYLNAYNLGCKSCTTHRPNEVTGSVLSVEEPQKQTEPVQNEISWSRMMYAAGKSDPDPVHGAFGEPDFKMIEEGFSKSAFPFDNPDAPPELIAARDHAVDVIDRAVHNSPPPLDDVGGIPAETFDEKDPNRPSSIDRATMENYKKILNTTRIDQEAGMILPSIDDEVSDDDEPDDLLPIRDEALTGTTYKVKWTDGNGDPSYYVTINDDPTTGQPFEIFVSTLDVNHQAWTTALTRMVSAIFRRGGDVQFVAEELRAIHDPKGGAWMGGHYVPSLPAAIGDVITKHLEQRTVGEDLIAGMKDAVAHARGDKNLARETVVWTEREDREADTVGVPPAPSDVKVVGVAVHDASAGSLVNVAVDPQSVTAKDAIRMRECPRCHGHSIIMQEGCARCTSCEWSRCD